MQGTGSIADIRQPSGEDTHDGGALSTRPEAATLFHKQIARE